MCALYDLDIIRYVFKLWFEYLLWCIPLAVCTMLLLAPMLAIMVRINLWLAGYIIKNGRAVKRTAPKKKGLNNGKDNR